MRGPPWLMPRPSWQYNLDFRGSEMGRAHSQCGYQEEEYSYSDGGGGALSSKGGPGTVSSSDPGI
ncbi:hypothetical protein IscW_ISCW005914 [Ixodes scapularis]|uniref:Uncharacterized protein n=1 Tax=Ixodes scapularis TaxID=6945 RepID=B7PPY9_IXOSC|nr:hypothetical protein IscW_ISCW005914 [Ixodes scapularis]|eukprot:XP_002435831.1 hypothetical protein IscW_ISCW005914 [Ixodes scapularis]